MYSYKKIIYLLLLITFSITTYSQSKQPIRTLIVFFDGLRPDYITPELMPNLYAFRKAGAYGKAHHSVYPTVTRVNASSYSTGSYPGTHGLMGNTVYFPEVDKTHGLNTGDAGDLFKIVEATHDHLLTATSMGELLQVAGKRMYVFSSGSTGQALMQNHKVGGGAVINPGLILPENLKATLVNELGPVPPHQKPNTAQHQWVADALLKFGLVENGPEVSAIWFSDPDGTAHSDGIGSETANASIRSVDHEFGRIIEYMKSKGLDNSYNILISTDHGFITHSGKESVGEFLIGQGLKESRESDDVIMVGGAIYVKNHDSEKIQQIVTVLQAQPWVGAIFTKAKAKGSDEGYIAGTLSYETIHWDHAGRSADILVDVNWNDAKNAAGYAGTNDSRGVAGHGGLSPYEVHIPLIVSGPAFKKQYESALPTSNVDLVPTVLYLMGIQVPATMDGRVMNELLVKPSSSATATVKKKILKSTVTGKWGTYTIQLQTSVLGKYRYVDFGKVVRTVSTARTE